MTHNQQEQRTIKEQIELILFIIQRIINSIQEKRYIQ